MEYILKISTVKFENNLDDNYKMVAFAESEINQEKYVICQRAFRFDKQDMELDMDSYYFEVEDQSNSGYNVCKKVYLFDSNVVFDLKKEFGGKFEKIILDVSNANIEQDILDEYLRFIFKDIYRNGGNG